MRFEVCHRTFVSRGDRERKIRFRYTQILLNILSWTTVRLWKTTTMMTRIMIVINTADYDDDDYYYVTR